MEKLTGPAADAYLDAWMAADRAGVPLHAARVRHDALAARTSRAALTRLRVATIHLSRRIQTPPAAHDRPRCIRSTCSRRTATGRRRLCKPSGTSGRPGVGV